MYVKKTIIAPENVREIKKMKQLMTCTTDKELSWWKIISMFEQLNQTYKHNFMNKLTES